MVARDDEHAQPKRGELGEELVEELDRLRARNRLIVDIAGEDDATVRPLLAQDRENLFQNVTLILQHRKCIDALPDMKIREMDEFHGKSFRTLSYFSHTDIKLVSFHTYFIINDFSYIKE